MLGWFREICSSLTGKVLLAALLLLLAGTISAGFLLGGGQFTTELLAGLVGAAFSVLFALLVVDWFIEWIRRKEWRKIGKATLGAISVHLCETAGALFLHYSELDYRSMEPIFSGHVEPPNESTLRAFDDLLKNLEGYQQPLEEAKRKSTSDIAIDYYEEVKWDLGQIRDILIPRVLGGPKDQELAESLVQLDQAHRELQHAIIAHKQVCTQSVFPYAIVPLIREARNVYEVILRRFSSSAKS